MLINNMEFVKRVLVKNVNKSHKFIVLVKIYLPKLERIFYLP